MDEAMAVARKFAAGPTKGLWRHETAVVCRPIRPVSKRNWMLKAAASSPWRAPMTVRMA